MKNKSLKIALSAVMLGAVQLAQGQLILPPTGPWDNPNSISVFETTTPFSLGVGTTAPRAWQEILYCTPPNKDEAGLIVTQKECAIPNVVWDWTQPDMDIGKINFTEGGGNNDFVVSPSTFLTGNLTQVGQSLFAGSKAPLFWARTEFQSTAINASGTNNFQTRFIVMPEGGVGINIAQPRAALDVRGSNGNNRPAAIIGSRALGTQVQDNGLWKYYTQQVSFVPILKENGYNRISEQGDQGMFFSDGKGINGCNQNSAFVIAPWSDGSSDKGGMRMDADGNTEFHGTLKATKMDIGIKWWSDFVFAPSYKLMPLNEVELFVNSNKHLPGIPSEKELLESGLDVANMQALHMQKIEELTLYTIEQEKKIQAQNERIAQLELLINQLINKK